MHARFWLVTGGQQSSMIAPRNDISGRATSLYWIDTKIHHNVNIAKIDGNVYSQLRI
jgi:hypothetical protein